MKKNLSTFFFNRMRFLFLILFSTVTLPLVNAQMVYLPDTNFRNELIIQGYGSCIVGDSIDGSCPVVMATIDLNVSESNIYNLQGVQAFVNLHKLNCRTNNLDSLPDLPHNLDTLNCGVNHLASLPVLSNPLLCLYCDTNLISSLAFPPNLLVIDCSYNPISNLPVLPSSLLYLYCINDTLSTLPSLPASLLLLDCSHNAISLLPVLPATLQYLFCDENQLTILSGLPNSLGTLSCSRNQIISLTTLPASLIFLNCIHNQLTNLPNLPNSLGYLACDYNQIAILPLLPNTLTELSCGFNSLTNLPPLPNSLRDIICDANHISSINALPTSLIAFSASTNYLTSLPALPPFLNVIDVANNQLSQIPELPDSMYVLNLASNTNIHCLPQLKKISNLYFYNTAVTCLPNYGNVSYSLPSLNSLPLCNIFNSDACNVFWNISGKSYFDSNNNCWFDSTDVLQQNMHILLYQNGSLMQQVFTGGEGYYSFDIDSNFGVYKTMLDTTEIPFEAICPVNNSYSDTITSIHSLHYTKDFSLQCKNGFDIGAFSIVADRFRALRHTTCKIEAGDYASFYGVHCANGISGTVTITLNGAITYLCPDSGALSPTLVSGNTISYAIADFGTVNLFTDFNIVVVTDTFAVVGSPICISVSVTPILGDNNPGNNILSHCFVCTGSIDPNDKEVDPVADIDIDANGWLTYTIHFQNVGSAPAEHIYITDTLDQNLDLSTFQLLAYSHQPFVQVLNGGIAKFNFPNINLPDSISNEPGSHGYIQYKIKLKSTATPGSQVSNRAYIYFDFNNPVPTNITSNNITSTVGISSVSNNALQFSIFPNPGYDEFTVFCSQYTSSKKVMLTLLDLFGKEIFSAEMKSTSYQLHAAGLAAGIYLLRMESGGGAVIRKLVKE